MFLTRIPLNHARHGTARLMESRQRLHAAIEACWPETRDRSQRVLWRLDTQGIDPVLWVVSPTPPSTAHFTEQAGWPGQDTAETRDYTPLVDSLSEGSVLAFELTVNPTVKRAGKRVALRSVDDQNSWLVNRAEKLGMRVLDAKGVPTFVPVVSTTHRFLRDGRTVTVQEVTYRGLLTVTDADALRTTLVEGVGAGKAYGMGLLTLARA